MNCSKSFSSIIASVCALSLAAWRWKQMAETTAAATESKEESKAAESVSEAVAATDKDAK